MVHHRHRVLFARLFALVWHNQCIFDVSRRIYSTLLLKWINIMLHIHCTPDSEQRTARHTKIDKLKAFSPFSTLIASNSPSTDTNSPFPPPHLDTPPPLHPFPPFFTRTPYDTPQYPPPPFPLLSVPLSPVAQDYTYPQSERGGME